MKPIAAKWIASSDVCGKGSDSGEYVFLGIHGGDGAAGTGLADIFLPHFDLSRAGPHDYRPHPRTSGHFRSGDRAEAENQPAQRRRHVPPPPDLSLGLLWASNHTSRG